MNGKTAIVWESHGYRIEEHRSAFGHRMPLQFALDRREQSWYSVCWVNVGWYATLDAAHRARNADLEQRANR